MTLAGRVAFGASLSALFTLCLHPDSRPYMVGLGSQIPPAVLQDTVDSNALKLAEPTNLPQASLWMQFASERLMNRQKFTPKEWQSLMSVAEAAQRREVTNAFWPQMEAALYEYVNKPALAKQAWIDASICSKWDDWQTARLLQSRTLISDLTGTRQSWQCAFLYYQRSNSVPDYLAILAKRLLAGASSTDTAGLRLRYATLQNGQLMRINARSTKANIDALTIIQLAAVPADAMINPIGPKPLIIAQDTLSKNIRTILHDQEAAEKAISAFKEAESYRALTVHASNDENAQLLAAASVVSASIAGAFALVACLGAIIWVIGWLVAWRLAQGKAIKWYVVAVIAAMMAVVTYLLTRDLWSGLATALCAVFLSKAPDRSRKARPTNIGPLFSFITMVLGVVFATLFVGYLIGRTPAAGLVLPHVGVPPAYFDKPLMAGLASVAFGLVLLIAPIWAVVHKLGTPYVLALTLMRFGSFVAVMGLCLSIVLGPVSVYIDRRLEVNLYQILTNEPQHYKILA